MRWPGGAVHHLHGEAVIFRDPEGRPARMVGVCYDVTEQKTTEQELRRHRIHLEELVAERTNALSVAVRQAQAANRRVKERPCKHLPQPQPAGD